MKRHFTLMGIIVVLMMIMPGMAFSQSQPGEKIVIGVLNLAGSAEPYLDGFREGMSEIGYHKDRVTYIYEGALGKRSKLESGIQNFLEAHPDLIFTITTPAAQAAKLATENIDIPVVFVSVSDPLGSGIVDNLEKPGGNITGVKVGGPVPKILEWLLILSPKTKRILVPHRSNNPSSVRQIKSLKDAALKAKQTGKEFDLVVIAVQDQISPIFADVHNHDAVFLTAGGWPNEMIALIGQEALKHNLPVVTMLPIYNVPGILFSYTTDIAKVGKQASAMVNQILHGVQPGDISVATAEFYLSVNLQTAHAINLDVPSWFVKLARPEHVIYVNEKK